MSSTYVKSRRIWPLLKTSIGRFSRMAFVNRNAAMSGRPHGPYTVKNRKPVSGNPHNRLYASAISSQVRLVAPYNETGWSTRSSILNGCFLFAPYTEEDEA